MAGVRRVPRKVKTGRFRVTALLGAAKSTDLATLAVIHQLSDFNFNRKSYLDELSHHSFSKYPVIRLYQQPRPQPL